MFKDYSGIFKPPFRPDKKTADSSITTISVDCVIFGLQDYNFSVLLIKSDFPDFLDKWSLLGDIVEVDESLHDAAYRVLSDRTGLSDLYLEQVKSFGNVKRHPAGRVITVAYYALVNIDQVKLLKNDNELHWHRIDQIQKLAFDHNDILDTCIRRLRDSIRNEPVGLNLLPSEFTLRDLQSLYETVLGVTLDRRNFRKKFFSTGLLIDLKKQENKVRHRPAKLYSFDFKKYEEMKEESIHFI